ncbi:hypothetical protein Q31b_05740 [Novipirellula aureliae]|uniref:Uncharacterized protein n=1 Tax=Novipirellula aureliae TaxID=2527966 RepID=A0A5C6E8T6_9BACT|nr:hypothetical protein [Novipirellula aureliae]TWU45402.1 hypothetical protein Q31b_05740 [Novipirellula aureliae]
MTPKHSIDYCPICGGGLCGVRICGLDETTPHPHGLIVCDECEAIWLEPDISSPYQYPDADDSRCPICSQPLWGNQSHWANEKEVEQLGWKGYINPTLDPIDDDEMPVDGGTV